MLFRFPSLSALFCNFGGVLSFFAIPLFHVFYVQLALFFFNFFFWILANEGKKDYIYLSRVESIPKFSEKNS
mgnify:CR=1 FL=1